jgi:hypothetical protein
MRVLPGEDEIVASTLIEIARWRGIGDLALVRRRCEGALGVLKLRCQVSARFPCRRRAKS